MQKTVRINIQARNQLAKRALKKNRHATRTEWREWRQANTANDRKRIDYAREERKNRREDWLLGPLAPNRNVGTDKGLIGTVNAELINSPELPRVVREKPTKDTASIAGNVVATDQVVVVAGPERIKGRIGYVADVNNASQEIVITNVNVADIRIPFHAPQNPADKNTPEPVKFETREMGIPMSDVRLIAVLPSGEQMIARHVYASGPYAQRAEGSNLPRHTRYIAGTAHLNDGKDVILPWPKEDRPRANRHHVSDTRAVTVEDENWIPSVYYPPLAYDFDVDVNRASVSKATTPYTLGMVEDPVTAGNEQRAGLHGFIDPTKLKERQVRISRGIMDELRNKMSRTNKIHDDNAWVKQKLLEDARAIWWQERKIMSPVSEAAEKVVEERKRAREERIKRENVVYEGAIDGATGKNVASAKMRLNRETEDLIRNMKEVSLAQRYQKPDMKFGKRLARMRPEVL